MRLHVQVFGRDVLLVDTDPAPAPAAEVDVAKEKATTDVTGGEFGFAVPAARTVDYPESRWDVTPYGKARR